MEVRHLVNGLAPVISFADHFDLRVLGKQILEDTQGQEGIISKENANHNTGLSNQGFNGFEQGA